MKRTILKFATAATAVLSIVAVAPQASGAKVTVPIDAVTISAANFNSGTSAGTARKVVYREYPNTFSIASQKTTVRALVLQTSPGLNATYVKVRMDQYLCSNGSCAWSEVRMVQYLCSNGRCAWIAVPSSFNVNSGPKPGVPGIEASAVFDVSGSAQKVRLAFEATPQSAATPAPSAGWLALSVSVA